MITAHHDMETTIAAMRRGAYDYIHKPLDVEELEKALDKALHIARTTLSTAPLVGSGEPPPGRRLVGNTPSMREIFKEHRPSFQKPGHGVDPGRNRHRQGTHRAHHPRLV